MTLSAKAWPALAVSALTLLATAPVAQAAPPALAWTACGAAQCATLTVPADWRDPSGPTTTIDVARIPAKNPAQRTGTVIANLGAGNSTFATINPPPFLEPTLRHLSQRLDVVTFDPRGLGRTAGSTRYDCGTHGGTYNGLLLAADEQAWNAHAEAGRRYADSCREALGAKAAGLNSRQITQDLEALRIALGEPKLRYFGNSYGTVYGQNYARLYPERVERMYLDGVADQTTPRLEAWLRNYAVALEKQLGAFADWCGQRTGCFLHGQDVLAAWDDLVARASKAPLPAPSLGRTLDLRQLHASGLYGANPPRWPVFAKAIAQARAGDAALFLTDLNNGGDPSARHSETTANQTLCNDFMPATPGYHEFQGIERRLKAAAPRFGWAQARFELGRCLGAVPTAPNPPKPLHLKQLAPVLVGIGEIDQNTNTLGAAHVAGQLPDSQVLRHGDGHAAYLLGNTCLREHVGRYLTEGTLPAKGTRCPGELINGIPDRP